MIKDNSYYNKHKVVYNDELQKLETEIISQIFDDPQSDESQLLNERVDRILKEELDI
tara:strand:- start:700 stop:870 length:171 start_codon:yes stop_codon:yes gene_type:complete